MNILVLVIIFAFFIGLGLPDALLGAWASIYQELVLPVSAVSLVSFMIASSTVCASIASNAVVKRLQYGKTLFLAPVSPFLGFFGGLAGALPLGDSIRLGCRHY